MNKQAEYVRHRAAAANWLSVNRDAAGFFNWPVLTSANPNSNPRIPESTAFNIFTEFEARKLLVPYLEHGVPKGFKLNFAEKAAWAEVSSVPSTGKAFGLWVVRSIGAGILWFLAVGTGAFLGAYFQHYFEAEKPKADGAKVAPASPEKLPEVKPLPPAAVPETIGKSGPVKEESGHSKKSP